MTAPSVWIQWKGTDVCMDFRCTCDPEFLGHFDGYGAYAIQCPRCGQVYEVGQTIRLRPVAETKFEPQLVSD
jgi:hypothetical protein